MEETNKDHTHREHVSAHCQMRHAMEGDHITRSILSSGARHQVTRKSLQEDLPFSLLPSAAQRKN